jgi:hypothetical protein
MAVAKVQSMDAVYEEGVSKNERTPGDWQQRNDLARNQHSQHSCGAAVDVASEGRRDALHAVKTAAFTMWCWRLGGWASDRCRWPKREVCAIMVVSAVERRRGDY